MKSSAVSNKESTLFFGPGKVRAAAARRFDSIEDIQGNRDLIADSQTVNGINAAANDKMSDFRDLAAREIEVMSFQPLIEQWRHWLKLQVKRANLLLPE